MPVHGPQFKGLNASEGAPHEKHRACVNGHHTQALRRFAGGRLFAGCFARLRQRANNAGG
jgi:hypothetical protein